MVIITKNKKYDKNRSRSPSQNRNNNSSNAKMADMIVPDSKIDDYIRFENPITTFPTIKTLKLSTIYKKKKKNNPAYCNKNFTDSSIN